MTGTVVFSLDFELGWGHADVRPEYVKKLRTASGGSFDRIRSLIDLFDEYEIPATWATVGRLTETGDDPLFHNPSLFEYLLDADVEHDIGLHSYEHLPFTELSESSARADLQSGVEALQRWGIRPRSFIYPRGLTNHVQLLPEYEFTCYRVGRSVSKFDTLKQLLFPTTVEGSVTNAPSEPASIPRGMFLAARRPLRYRKWMARRAISRAATEDGFVHFWWHPHNVISQPEILDLLPELFDQIHKRREIDDLRCQPMAPLAE